MESKRFLHCPSDVKCGLGEDEQFGGHQKSTGCSRYFMFSNLMVDLEFGLR